MPESDIPSVVILNPATCGVNSNGGTRYKVNRTTGRRMNEVDDELNEHVDLYLAGADVPGKVEVSLADLFQNRNLVPRYYDKRWDQDFRVYLNEHGLESITLGELEEEGVILVRGGHGSPSSDARVGNVPYVKVSDIRSLRVNVNPTNLVPRAVAERKWGGTESGLHAWDIVTPNRASSNIGEFAVILPGEEQVVITREVFVIRVLNDKSEDYDPFYLLWALCLKAVRKQWRRVTLMQTNREDVKDRYREIAIPKPPSPEWAREVSAAFRDYFTVLAEARGVFMEATTESPHEYIASVRALASPSTGVAEEVAENQEDDIEDNEV